MPTRVHNRAVRLPFCFRLRKGVLKSINAVSKTAVNKRTKPDMLPKKARPIIPSATASMSMSRESLSNP